LPNGNNRATSSNSASCLLRFAGESDLAMPTSSSYTLTELIAVSVGGVESRRSATRPIPLKK
jgi:hypothetical protein